MKHILSPFVLILSLFSIVNGDSIADRYEHFEHQKNIFKKLKNQKNLTIPFKKTKKPKIISSKKSKKCFYLKHITENSITLISDKKKKEIFDKFIGRCVTLSDLINLTNMLNSLYIDKGYITSKVYLPPQNISEGIIKLKAIEGKINTVKPNKRYINIVFMNEKDKPLNLRDLETSIKLINRLPSNHATMQLKPGKKVGYTNIIIHNRKTKRVNASIGINNFGTKKTGKIQGNFLVSIDDILGINDQLLINLNGTDKQFKNENSTGDLFSYSFPLFHFLNTLSYKKTNYKEFILAGITNYKTNGQTKTYEYDLSYELFHDQYNALTAKGSLEHSKSQNFIDGTLIQTSSYSLSSVGFDIDYLYRSKSFYSLLSFGLKQGVDWFGTLNPTDLNEKYSLYNIDLTLQKSFQIFDYTLSAHSQYTNDKLFSKDQISIGGAYSVRGYQEEGLSGNSGYFIRNEFSKTLKTKFLKKFIQTYFIAFDGGHIKKESDTNAGSLFSYSIGTRVRNKKFIAEISYSVPVYKQDVKITKDFLGFGLTYSF